MSKSISSLPHYFLDNKPFGALFRACGALVFRCRCTKIPLPPHSFSAQPALAARHIHNNNKN